MAELAELAGQPDGWIEIRLSIKNASEKPITVCYYSNYYFYIDPKTRHVQVEFDAKKLGSKHNNYGPANNPLVSKKDFVAIAPTKSLRISPTVRFHPATMKPLPES